MPKISFIKGFPPISVEPGSNLMKALTSGGRPVGSSCGGEGVCSKCVIRVVDGMANLSPRNPTEDFLNKVFVFDEDLRVSCQTDVVGDITVDIDYW